MSRRVGVGDRMARSTRVRIALVMLAAIVLPAIFAELIAADAPIFAAGPHGVYVLPAVVKPASYHGLDRAGIEALHDEDFAVWPVIRCGPSSTCPEGAHLLGADGRGRDLVARVVYGGRSAIGLAVLALAFATVVGVCLGAVAGYLGGFWDEVLARPIEVVQAFPAIVVVAVVRAAFPDQNAAWSLVLAVAAVRWAEVARLVRAEVIQATAEPWVLAARAIGCGHWRVMRRHILPQAMRPVVVSTMFGVASVVLLETAVSFLGLGVDGSWGAMLAEGLGPASAAATVAGGLALGGTVLAVYFIADAFEEALDARVATTSRELQLW
jgi:peptide/nickel transport system permease protein